MKSFFFTIVLLLVSATTLAVPADRVQRNVVQPDGKLIAIRQFGDEYFHYMMTLDGYLVIEGESEGLYYLIYDEGHFCPSNILAHNPDQRSIVEKKYLSERQNAKYDEWLLDSIRDMHHQLRDRANARRRSVRQKTIGVPSTYIGQKNGLVILVEFPNLQMSSQTSNDDYQQMFNSPGYSDNNHVGSVHDYFFDQSYGQFDLTFDIVGPVTVSKNYGYYGSDSMSGYNDMNVHEMILEACNLADEYVNFQDYDWDSDGVVDQVFIIYAGYGQATGGASNTIWPHESYLTNGPVLDNVTVSQYACSNELFKSLGTEKTLMGIGTACHEFSHCLGLPDIYDTDYSGAFGMSYWGVMNSGGYNGPKGIGEVPCGYTAFERWFVGWLDFIDIEESQKIQNFPSLEVAPIAYRITNEGNTNEFYTFENRQPDKWFKYVAQYQGLHGLLVTHIDYDLKAWATNKVNPTPNHQRMSPVVADNSYGEAYSNLAGDLFPGSKKITELTNTSHVDCGGRLFNKNWDGSYNMNKSVLNIQDIDGLLSFDVIFNYELPTPIALEATYISNRSFKASWSSESAESYTLELEIVKSVKPFLSEKVIIENILDTEYLVCDIDAVFCNYRVRANRGELHTEWSNMISVSLDGANGIKDFQNQSGLDANMVNTNGIPLNNPRKGIVIIRNSKKYLFK